MNPRKSNQGKRKAQEPLGQGSVPPRDGTGDSANRHRAPNWTQVVEAAFRSFIQVLDAVRTHLDDKAHCDMAKTLLPLARQLLARLEELVRRGPSNMVEPPCDSCTQRHDCKAQCRRPEARVNGAYEGKLHGEKTVDWDLDDIRARRASPDGHDGDEKDCRGDRGAFRDIRKVESLDAMESYKPCWEHLSHKQQEVVRLYHGEGKGITEVAESLDKSPSTVHGLLSRAREIKKKHNEQMRREELGLLRELETKICKS